MNKKQFAVTGILICLMVVLVAGEKIFDSNIRKVSLTNNNIGNLNFYSALDETISYQLPNNWEITEKKYPGDYIVYDNSFVGSNMGIFGYVQIMNTTNDIELIMKEDRDKLPAEDTYDYKASIENIKGENIYKATYGEKNYSGKRYIKTIYYKIIEENKILKVFFSSDEDKYKENYSTIYQVILDSFKVQK